MFLFVLRVPGSLGVPGQIGERLTRDPSLENAAALVDHARAEDGPWVRGRPRRAAPRLAARAGQSAPLMRRLTLGPANRRLSLIF